MAKAHRSRPVWMNDAEINPLGQPLTGREREVAALLVRGFSNKEMANKFGITRHTISNHVRRISEKFGTRSRTAAAVRWWQLAEAKTSAREADAAGLYYKVRPQRGSGRRGAALRNGVISLQEAIDERERAWGRFRAALLRRAPPNALRQLLGDWHWWDWHVLMLDGQYPWGNAELYERLGVTE